ncbi:MAG: cyclase family protein [Sphingomonas sp.]|nr:cyclase family protein [Sphingomonas sp.]
MTDRPRLARRSFLAGGTAALLSAGLPAGAARPRPLLMPARDGRISEGAFRLLAQRVSNWGRWGAADRLGALNEITPAVRFSAARLIRQGISVHCGGPIPSLQQGSGDKSGRIDLRLDRANDWGAVNDIVELDVHGHFRLTHLDALGHIFYRGQHYNGVPFTGFRNGRVEGQGIETARAGISGRGVFLDLAAAVGKPWLEPTDRVTPEGLRRAIAATGTRLLPGDILLFNTGFAELQAARGTRWGEEIDTGGLQVECAEMLHAARPALILSDAGFDSFPSEVERVKIPWHVLTIVMMGVRLVDCGYLQELRQTCRKLARSTFFCSIAPVEYTGATSSPVNPVCFF